MAKLIIAFTLCLCMAAAFAEELNRPTAERPAGASSVEFGPRGPRGVNAAARVGGVTRSAGSTKPVGTKDASGDQETASSFYGVGFYGPGYGGFGGPFGYGGGFPYGGFGGFGGFGYGWPGIW